MSKSASKQRMNAAIAGADRAGTQEDHRLVERCLQAAPGAWDELYDRCHNALIAAAMAMHGGRPDSRQIAEEIVARVWYGLISKDFRLLRLFAVERGCSLIGYLTAICRHQVLNFRREERRRRAHEVTSSSLDDWQSATSDTICDLASLGLKGFLEQLTPREQQFYREILLKEVDIHTQGKYSSSNLRQLRSRVRRKLLRFLGK